MPTYSRRRSRQDRRAQSFMLKIAMLALALFILSWTARSGRPEEPAASSIPTEVPGWVEQDFLPINEYSRPGTPLEAVNGVVVHYTGNPGTTARQNRSYFAGLSESQETYASSQFIIDLDGSVLQCVPLDEVAYCSSQRNADTISIEVCHPDESGAFTPEAQQSLIKLVQWACDTYELSRDQVLRHYDVTGKECPRYFVEHPDAWEAFLDSLTF